MDDCIEADTVAQAKVHRDVLRPIESHVPRIRLTNIGVILLQEHSSNQLRRVDLQKHKQQVHIFFLVVVIEIG